MDDVEELDAAQFEQRQTTGLAIQATRDKFDTLRAIVSRYQTISEVEQAIVDIAAERGSECAVLDHPSR